MNRERECVCMWQQFARKYISYFISICIYTIHYNCSLRLIFSRFPIYISHIICVCAKFSSNIFLPHLYSLLKLLLCHSSERSNKLGKNLTLEIRMHTYDASRKMIIYVEKCERKYDEIGMT